jgi:hypothetical protein
MLHPELGPVELGDVMPHVLMSLLYLCIILASLWGPEKLGTAGTRPTFHFTGATVQLMTCVGWTNENVPEYGRRIYLSKMLPVAIF